MPYQIKTLETIADRTERTYIKISLGALIGLALFIFVCWSGWRAYVEWQDNRLVRAGQAQLEKGDTRAASLTARAALQLKPKSIGASRIVAEIGERTNDRTALEWRRKVVALRPGSVEDILAWAKCALQFNDTADAERALSQLPPAAKNTADYHATAALMAQARKQPEKADEEWAEACRLAPQNKSYLQQFAVARLRSGDDQRHEFAVSTLNALRQDPQQRLAATRALIEDGLTRHQDSQELLEMARQLQAYPGATLSDRLIYLSFLQQLGDPQFASYLTELESQVTTNASDLATLLAWLSRNNLNILALDFTRTLPKQMMERWPLPLAVADLHVRLKEWKKLEDLTKNANWHQFDFSRHAYLARALREMDRPAAAEHEWAAAVKGAGDEPETMLALLETVSEWGWDTEAVDLLWDLSKRPEKMREAISSLYKYYSKTQNTQGLYRVLLRLIEIDPQNLNVQNNLAQISLLLNATPDDARRMAADVYRKEPKNPAYVTTYAYSLLTKGDRKNALDAMASLTEADLREPAISAYYGICLAAAGDQRAAKHYLQLGERASLLPEEKELLKKAWETVR